MTVKVTYTPPSTLKVQPTGAPGLSAYAVAVGEGYSGTVEEWLASLVGPTGASAYEAAVEEGFVGDQAAWVASLAGADGQSAYEVAVANGFVGDQAAWLASLIGPEGPTAVSTDAGNVAALGTDSLIYVPTPTPAPVDSVNAQTGVVVLDAADVGAAAAAHEHPAAEISDATVTGQALITAVDAAAARAAIGAGTGSSDFDGAYSSLSGTPTLGTAAAADAGDFATAAQGSTADSAVQPGDLGTAAVLDVPATGDAAAGEVVKGDDSRLSDARTPTAHSHTVSDVTDAGTAASADATDFATAAQGGLADSAVQPADLGGAAVLDVGTTAGTVAAGDDARIVAGGTAVQPGDLATVATSGAYADLSGTPALGTAAALDVPATGDAAAGEVVLGSDSRLGGGGATALDDLTDVSAASPADGDALVWDATGSAWIPAAVAGGGSTLPTGGTVTVDGDYRVHTFTAGDTFVVPAGDGVTAEVLLVGGGGAGGSYRAGGGGGGGVVHQAAVVLPAGSYAVNVGAGGSEPPESYGRGGDGGDSSAFGYTAYGGGAGGYYDTSYANNSGNPGGSGGGVAAHSNGGAVGVGTVGQGNDGGQAFPSTYAGGGGGAGAVGESAISGSAGDGGAGAAYSISGASVYYGGGGGGAGSANPGTGGSGGGGNGVSTGVGLPGVDGLGGGGGGSYLSGVGNHGGAGGSGVVIVRYAVPVDGGVVPAGGTAGQVLAKASGTDFDTTWADPAASGASALDDLTDVDTSTSAPATGNALVWDGTNWVPGVVSGGGGGTGVAFLGLEWAGSSLVGTQTRAALSGSSYAQQSCNLSTPGGPFRIDEIVWSGAYAVDTYELFIDGVSYGTRTSTGTDEVLTWSGLNAVTSSAGAEVAFVPTGVQRFGYNSANGGFISNGLVFGDWVESPGNTVPMAVTFTPLALVELTTSDMPAGGTAGQVLAKASGTDFDTGWVDPAAGGGGASLASVFLLMGA